MSHQPSDEGAKEYCSHCEERGDSRATQGRKGIVVVARSEAIAERRGNLAKSLSDGRERLLRLLARKDTEGEDCFAGWLARTRKGKIASPAGSQ
ncbi:hypothetical protein AUK14_01670 [Candidatus Berkelbacteria bacterium CG2_30_39_44]|nr:MAG: hypothetical protein AUK14_01670 [Candidatus Berkelbacteria bacterium CG2_30_39_44]